MFLKISCFVLLYVICCDAYTILVLFHYPTQSHRILGDGYVKLLLNAGHEITYVTPFPIHSPHENLTLVDISENKLPESVGDMNLLMNSKIISSEKYIMEIMTDLSIKTLENEKVKDLLSDPARKFDLIIAEWIYSELFSGMSAVFDCPYIWSVSTEPHPYSISLVGEPPNPAYSPTILSTNITPLNFLERIEELWNQITMFALRKFIVNEENHYERLFEPILKKKGKTLPAFQDVKYNVSLVISNSHVSLGDAILLPQNYKTVAGYYIESDVEPLPKTLKFILDNATEGAIYFSMGSSLRSKSLPQKIINDLKGMFGLLNQTVIWKYEDELSGLPKNLHTMKWVPQTSILAHSNCRLFINQGGKLSITEAVHFGKPIIGIPMGSDQFVNIKRAERKGFARKVNMSYNLANELNKAITELLSDSTFTAKAKELSRIYHDRPLPPSRELVHWVEHVVRTRGAAHLRSPALMVPWYQKMYLDLIVLIVVLGIVLKIIIIGIKNKFVNNIIKIKLN